MQHFPPPDVLEIMTEQRAAAPLNGAPFHNSEHLALFNTTPPWAYQPNAETIRRMGELQAVASIMGAFAVGKNAAKNEALRQSTHATNRAAFPHGLHEVVMGTTRLPLFRDGYLEDEENYMFCFRREENEQLVKWMQNGDLVQWAQPRGDHVYFSWIGSYPDRGVALLDTVPQTLHDLDRILAPSGKQALGLYRTAASFEDWWSRVLGRKDVVVMNNDDEEVIIDPEDYDKRMREAVRSLTEALDMHDRLTFFEADEPHIAGKIVLEIIKNPEAFTAERQSKAVLGAYDMLRGLARRGFKAA